MPELPPRLEAIADRLSARTLRLFNRCVLLRRSLDAEGYPRRWKDGRLRYAHRLAFEEHWHPLEEGERVYRWCGNRNCVNRWHLVTEPPARTAAVRRRGSTRLTKPKVRAIRAAWALPEAERPTQQELADEHRVSRSCISLVVRGVTWTDV